MTAASFGDAQKDAYAASVQASAGDGSTVTNVVATDKSRRQRRRLASAGVEVSCDIEVSMNQAGFDDATDAFDAVSNDVATAVTGGELAAAMTADPAFADIEVDVDTDAFVAPTSFSKDIVNLAPTGLPTPLPTPKPSTPVPSPVPTPVPTPKPTKAPRSKSDEDDDEGDGLSAGLLAALIVSGVTLLAGVGYGVYHCHIVRKREQKLEQMEAESGMSGGFISNDSLLLGESQGFVSNDALLQGAADAQFRPDNLPGSQALVSHSSLGPVVTDSFTLGAGEYVDTGANPLGQRARQLPALEGAPLPHLPSPTGMRAQISGQELSNEVGRTHLL